MSSSLDSFSSSVISEPEGISVMARQPTSGGCYTTYAGPNGESPAAHYYDSDVNILRKGLVVETKYNGLTIVPGTCGC